MVQHSPQRHWTRALIVDDEVWCAIGLAEDMRTLGFRTCDLAADGHEASLKAMEHQPDIVLIDVNLAGGREGIEVGRWLREVCNVPVIFVTGYADRATLARINEVLPGAPVVPKPVFRDRLASAVAEVGPSPAA